MGILSISPPLSAFSSLPSASPRFFHWTPRWDRNKVEAMKATRYLVLLVLFSATMAIYAQPKPGPENGGLRLRFEVLPHPDGTNEGYDVKVDLLNVTNRDITLQAKWPFEGDAPGAKDYVEAAISIETQPEIGPWMGQVGWFGPRTLPQPKDELKRGEALSFSWHTNGRHLKDKVVDDVRTQNPEFPFPGLYSVHATLEISADGRPVSLTSNEQMVPIGGSRDVPKSTCGHLTQIDANTKTARLNLGSMQKIERGDEFHIYTGYSDYNWKLTITQVASNYSLGHFEPLQLSLPAIPTNLSPDAIEALTKFYSQSANAPKSMSLEQARSNYYATLDFSRPKMFPNEQCWVILMPKK
jgi:hypothetical protein